MSALNRRQVVLGGLSLCCLSALARTSRAASAPFALEEVAPGLFVRRGVEEETSATNEGGIANIGFIVGKDAVAVFDPGGSMKDGERLRAAIRRKTDRPIVYLVLTHVHPDHIFGAGAFVRDKPEVVAHHNLPAALSQRGDYYRRRLEETLGKGAAGPIVPPTLLVTEAEPLALDIGDRPLLLTAHGRAHTDCDLSVLDHNTGLLLLGDLLFVGRVPSLDGSITGWIKELQALKTLEAKHAVPGHGPASVDWPSAASDLERYLDVVSRETRAAIAKGVPIEKAVDAVGMSERDRWKLFEHYHGHNVTQAYKELEWE